MTLRHFLPLLSLLLIIFSCGNDDDSTDPVDEFYQDALTGVSENELLGVWAIFNVGYEGQIFDVPINYQECGRDFLIFSENSVYTEYLFQSSDCAYELNTLSWELNNGVITLSNEFQQSDDLVVTSLSNNQFTFKGRLDIDEDGILDIVTFYLQRYTPNEIDIVTPTFFRNQDPDFENLIRFEWEAYEGFNQFDRYEIYRTFGSNCNSANEQLVFSTNDKDITHFTDLTPDAEEQLCYVLKVYTDQGLLGESFPRTVSTSLIYVNGVNLEQPVTMGNTIEFNWEPSEDPYFSHYELAFSNFGGGSGYGQQEYTVALIDDRELTSFVDNEPPYLNNPYYVLYVHNIFGNRSPFVSSEVNSFWQVPFIRPEIVGLEYIKFVAVDFEEPVVYFYGRESGSNDYNIHRFNYETNITEAVSNIAPQSSTSVPMKIIDSGFGKELIYVQGGKLAVYNAYTLEFKYDLDPGLNVSLIDDFQFTDTGYWLITDNDNVITLTRDNLNFEFVDEKPHFPNHQATYNYQVFALNNNKVLVGHNNEDNSYIYNLSNNGILTQEQIVPIPINDNWEGMTAYNSEGNYIINYLENRLYSTEAFSLLQSFGEPFTSSGLSQNGDSIYGTNNDRDWQVTSDSPHLKEAIRFNRISQQVTITNTIGFPHLIFENYNGDIVSISSGLKKKDIRDNINDTSDIFIEVLSLD